MMQDGETALLDWLNAVGLHDAADWLLDPGDFYAEGFANAVMSLCDSLPDAVIDQLEPRRFVTLSNLRDQAQRLNREQA